MLLEQAVFTVVDVETSGLRPESSRIIEIGMVRVEGGRITDQWGSLVDPQGGVGATHIHGIRSGDVIDAPLFGELAEEVVNRLEGSILAAHNLPFDWGFLAAELGRCGVGLPEVEGLCTLRAARRWLPGLARYRLGDVCEAVGVDLVGAHSALGDAQATAEMLLVILQRMGEGGVVEVPDPARWVGRSTSGPVRTKMRGEVLS